MYADKYVSQSGDVPEEPHYMILKFESMYIPGDERSRTNPGHGYPAHHERIVKYEVYHTAERLQEAVKELEKSSSRKDYRVFRVTPLKVQTDIVVSFTE